MNFIKKNERTLFLRFSTEPYWAYLFVGLIIFTHLTCSPPNVNNSEQSGGTNLWPKNFWIALRGQYENAEDAGILLNAYSGTGSVDKLPYSEEALQRSTADDEFITVIVSDRWHVIVGDRKEFVADLQDSVKITAYFEYVKELFIGLGELEKSIVNFEPDPFGSFSKIILSDYDGDPKNVPAKISAVDMPEISEINPPDNFAGFWQVIDHLRNKYSPNTMIAPTIKEWGIPARPWNPPAEGWSVDDPDVQVMVEYYKNYGVNWDALAFNFNDVWREDEEFKNIASYFATVAKAMENKNGGRVYPFIWKTMVRPNYFDEPIYWWSTNELSFQFRNIEYLASLGIRGMVIGYGGQLGNLYNDDYGLDNEYDYKLQDKEILPCWLTGYFNEIDDGCEIESTIGLVKVTE